MTGSRHEELISREKPAYDGVVPSGNSVMLMNLLRLNSLTGEPHWLDQARRGFSAFAGQLATSPTALSEMLLALDYLQDVSRQIVIVAPRDKPEAAKPLLDRMRTLLLPNRVVAFACEGEEMRRAGRSVSLLRDKKADGDRAVAYLCENQSCNRPTSDPEEFHRQLQQTRAGSRK